jgi:prephenate dehydratase
MAARVVRVRVIWVKVFLVRTLHHEQLAVVRPIVAFQGETGAFSERAAALLVPGQLTLLPCDSFDDAVRAVVNGHADYAVIPIENLIAGPVQAALDAIAAFTSLERVRELALPVRMALLGMTGTTIDQVREVLSHPIALKQVRRFLAEHPAIRAVEAPDTAGAARMVAMRRDPTVTAIAAPWAAKHYGLTILIEGIEDRADNATTFVLLRRAAQRV